MTHLRKMMLEELQRRNYSQTTVKAYLKIVESFANHFHRSPDQLGSAEIRCINPYIANGETQFYLSFRSINVTTPDGSRTQLQGFQKRDQSCLIFAFQIQPERVAFHGSRSDLITFEASGHVFITQAGRIGPVFEGSDRSIVTCKTMYHTPLSDGTL